MAYSKAKLKSNGDRASPCFKPFLIGKHLRQILTSNNKTDKEKNQGIREKTGAQNIVKEIKQYQEKWLQHVQRMDPK